MELTVLRNQALTVEMFEDGKHVLSGLFVEVSVRSLKQQSVWHMSERASPFKTRRSADLHDTIE
jgi:hypothetical protein